MYRLAGGGVSETKPSLLQDQVQQKAPWHSFAQRLVEYLEGRCALVSVFKNQSSGTVRARSQTKKVCKGAGSHRQCPMPASPPYLPGRTTSAWLIWIKRNLAWGIPPLRM